MLLHKVKNFGPCGQLSSAKYLEIYLINIVKKTAIPTVSCNKRKQRKKIENYHFKDFTSLLGHTKLAFAYTDNLTNIYSEMLQKHTSNRILVYHNCRYRDKKFNFSSLLVAKSVTRFVLVCP